ncbi:MAG: bifunctional folylpolyglutamate synthase/dihydrofolate synthase [Acidimicrobiia bacterium]
MNEQVDQDARAWLESHYNLETGVGWPANNRRETGPTRDRIEALLRYEGSPQLEYPAVHLTGTNGKTSTARMITQLLVDLGLSVGSYTSPHLERVNERISHQGEPIADSELDGLLETVSLVERELDIRPSYFEVLTAAAFRWFADLAVDLAVVEVGLGGTWDATNCLDTRVALVTNIAIDHVELLGPTRQRIAADKAGIIQPGSTLVLGERDPDLEPIFTKRGPARVFRRDADFGVRENSLAVGGRLVDLYTTTRSYSDVLLPLHGAHQADNAAVAIMAAEAFLGAPLDDDVVRSALTAVRSPGRLEVVRRSPLVLLDGAHNVAGAEALRAALDEAFAIGPRTLVIGLLREKEPHEMLRAIGIDDAARVLCCRAPSGRALDPEIVAAAARDLGVAEDRLGVAESVNEAVTTALLETPDDGQIVITGSLYVVGAARSMLVRP